MNSGGSQLAESVAFMIRFSREVTQNRNLTQENAQSVTHHALDMLHRFLANRQAFARHADDEKYDWYLVGLACFFISAKLNSTHYGGADCILKFFYNERPRPARSNKSEMLKELKDPKVKEVLDRELVKIEMEILVSLNFQFTQFEDLPLNHLRKFMKEIEEFQQRQGVTEKITQ